ncbi:MAG TPA: SH3 domain-containing protein [Alphaproteobacteria bacterium]|nr:SH3 domain-containing protein [Alphaproteobacteria bacterium]
MCSKRRTYISYYVLLFSLTALLSCGRISSTSDKREYAYVTQREGILRDRFAAVYNKVGLVHNGERVEVLERMSSRRIVRVRSSRGEEGWIQERYLTGQDTVDEVQRLALEFKDVQPQAIALTRAEVNLHAFPGRKTDHLYLLSENEKVMLLQRQVVDHNAPPLPGGKGASDKDVDSTDAEPDTPAQLEDWWLVRDSQNRVGWALGRLLYVDAPLEVARYAEGFRIVSFFVLDEAKDKDKQVPEYLLLLSDNKDGLPDDYTQIRVYSWNTKKHRYELAYRERNMQGRLPVMLGQENVDKEGLVRTFTLTVKELGGGSRQQRYRFRSPLVHKMPPMQTDVARQ